MKSSDDTLNKQMMPPMFLVYYPVSISTLGSLAKPWQALPQPL